MKSYNNKNICFVLQTVILMLFIVIFVSADVIGQESERFGSASDLAFQETAEQDSLGESNIEPLPFSFGETNQINFGALLAKAFGYFLLVVVLIFASVYLLRKFVYNRREFTSRNKAIQVLSTTYVGPKKSLLLVEAAGKILVLSATESQMNLITELEKEAYEEFIRGSLEEKKVSNSAGNQFGEILSKFLKRPK